MIPKGLIINRSVLSMGIQLKCVKCKARTTFIHDSIASAVKEHKKRGHSKETCEMLHRDRINEINESQESKFPMRMSKWDDDFIESMLEKQNQSLTK